MMKLGVTHCACQWHFQSVTVTTSTCVEYCCLQLESNKILITTLLSSEMLEDGNNLNLNDSLPDPVNDIRSVVVCRKCNSRMGGLRVHEGSSVDKADCHGRGKIRRSCLDAEQFEKRQWLGSMICGQSTLYCPILPPWTTCG
jgi:hypothetical protein